ncbi:MAG TPA: hypothetical protein DHV28_18105 [Ignavibacteriales bacterium]|nr:hypothetical protein [Ignavibacteriales bacterium]
MNKNNKPSIFLILIILFSFIFVEINSAQQVNRVYEDIGGGSGTTNTSVNSNDDTILYIVGGAVLVGVVVYALLQNKKTTEKSKVDTIAVNNKNEILSNNFLFKQNTADLQLPINVSIGMKRDNLLKDEKRYFVGLSYNF